MKFIDLKCRRAHISHKDNSVEHSEEINAISIKNISYTIKLYPFRLLPEKTNVCYLTLILFHMHYSRCLEFIRVAI